MVSPRRIKLGRALDALHRQTDFTSEIPQDPIAFPKRYSHPLDIEVVAWLAASLAYGRVALFQAAIEKILRVMGPRPHEFILDFDPKKDSAGFSNLYYRMNRGVDIACLLFVMQRTLKNHGSIGKLFAAGYRKEDSDIGPALERFIQAIRRTDTTPIYGKRIFPYGLSQFLSLPSKGSACKRLNLYLRWMVRPSDGLDFGLWSDIPPAKLIIPLDTHVLRISRYLGLTRRRTSGWQTAKEITEALKTLEPEDPLKYDFPICHLGISGNCPITKAPQKCRSCPLLSFCAKGKMLTA